jgi:hypothetical protein
MVQERYFALGEETTFKTPVAATKYLDVVVDAIVPYRQYLANTGAGSQAVKGKHTGREGARGTVTLQVRPNTITNLLKWVFGAVGSAQQGGTSAYKHTFDFADTLTKSFTGRLGKETHEEVYPGMVVDSIGFGGVADDDLVATATLIGGAAMTKTTIGTPTFSALDPFVFHQNTVKIGGATSTIVEAFGLTIGRSVSDYRVQGSKELPRIRPGARIINGSLVIDFVDTAELDRFVNDTTTSIEFLIVGSTIGATGYSYTLDLLMPNVYYVAAPTPSLRGRARFQANVNFAAMYDAGISGELRAYVINEETTI